MRISIDSNQLIKQGNILNQYASDINGYANDLNRIIDELNTAWAGSDSLKFVNSFKDIYIKTNLLDLVKTIQNHGDFLVDTAKKQQAIEAKFSSFKGSGN